MARARCCRMEPLLEEVALKGVGGVERLTVQMCLRHLKRLRGMGRREIDGLELRRSVVVGASVGARSRGRRGRRHLR
jgi:hypothetical protein